MEKPAATCPAGIRKILIAHRKSVQQGLSVTTGTALRSTQSHIETYRRVAEGAIGRIVSAHMSRMGGALWFRQRERGWSDMEYMLRNWVNFCQTSGDFLVEQMVHHVDQLLWFTNEMLPVSCEATGGRQRRQTGDQYDHFSVEYVYENGMRAHCTSRQINGCSNAQQYRIYGTKGYTDATSTIWDYDNNVIWKFEKPNRDDPDHVALPPSVVQEHIRLVNAIRTGKPVHEAESLAHSTLMSIMGRESAYTGKFITWDQIMASDLKLGPDTYEFGNVPWFKEEIPLPGTPTRI
jgi:predicted dehydrogenase